MRGIDARTRKAAELAATRPLPVWVVGDLGKNTRRLLSLCWWLAETSDPDDQGRFRLAVEAASELTMTGKKYVRANFDELVAQGWLLLVAGGQGSAPRTFAIGDRLDDFKIDDLVTRPTTAPATAGGESDNLETVSPVSRERW